MKKLLTFLTLLTLSIGVTWAETVTDALDRAFTGVTDGAGYSLWSGKTSNSNAVYAGQSAGGNNSIQLRSSNSNSGIVTTTSGGKVKSISITWNDGTASGRTLEVYGKNSAYSAATDLYNTSNQGTLLGSFTYDGKNVAPDPLTISGDYTYIGLRSKSGALYLTRITITWETSGGSTVETVATPTFSPEEGTYTEAQNVEINCTTSGATIYYTTDGNDPTTSSSVYSSAIPVSSTTTIKAIAVKDGMNNSQVASATYTIETPPAPGENEYELVTDASQLSVGDKIIIANTATTGSGYAISTTQNSNNRAATSVTISNNKITPDNSVQIITLEKDGDNWLFNVGNGYLYAASSSSNHLKTEATPDANGNAEATISISNNTATIEFQGTNTHNLLKYNSGSTIFSCYASGQSPVYIYKKVEAAPQASEVYIIGQVNGNDWDASEGLKMTYSSNNDNYIADIYCTGVNNGDDEGYSFFLFAKSLPYDWNNTSNLYGSGADGSYWGIGGNNESAFDEEIPLYEGSKNSYRLAAGLYTITVDLSGAEGLNNTDKSVKVTKRDVTMAINGSQYFEDTRDVTMTSNLTDIGGKIYYTTDGSNPSDPNSTRQEYTGAITISETTTFKAVAFIGNLYSSIVDKTFTKTPKTPVISPESCTFSEPLTVTITCETAGATIRYTLDGTNPTSTSTEYTAPLTISETTTVKARAFVGETYSNGIATAEYVYTEPYVPGEGDFVLVTSKDDLKAGREYIIITKNHEWAMSAVDGDAKKATASQDFTISQDFSTVTLTENSTVNVMKLVDGVENPDNKYWNLTQANGLNIYVQNTGTGIQEKAHGVGLSGYTDEVMINLTTSTNYAIITSGGRQILYQNGSNGAAGVFGHYANSNQDANGYQRVYLYYREGGEVTPEYTEVTLADLCATGVTTEGSNKYVISDRLVAVYADLTKGILWCKDEGNASIFPTSIKEGQVDYLYNDAEAQNQRDWDQSNWIALHFTTPTSTNGIDEMLRNAQNHYIKAGTIKGTYFDDVNYALRMDNEALDLVTPADEGGNVQPDYMPNVYCTSNFLPDNLNIHGSIENGDGGYTGDPQINTQNYFFMNPKIQEICEITYAQWDAFNLCFTVPTNSGFDGAVYVGWGYNVLGDLRNSLQDEHVYKFQAIVQRSDKESYGPKNVTTPYAGFTVYPVDLDGTGSDITTAINTVSVNGEVKSIKYVNVAGMVSDVPFQGVNIVVTEYTDGTRTTSKMLRK